MKLARGMAGMSSANVAELQDLLKQNGFDAGPTDGKFEGMTAQALRSFQLSVGHPPIGETSWETFDLLRRAVKGTEKAERERRARHVPVLLPDGLTYSVRAILSLAMEQIGTEELPLGSNRGPSIDRYTRRWGIPWSGCFLSWCIEEAAWYWDGVSGQKRHVLEIYPYTPGDWKDLMMKQGKYHVCASYLIGEDRAPAVGDIFLCFSLGEREGHCGFVVGYDEDSKVVTTIEGNNMNGVRSRERDLRDVSGWGKVYPLDDVAPSSIGSVFKRASFRVVDTEK